MQIFAMVTIICFALAGLIAPGCCQDDSQSSSGSYETTLNLSEEQMGRIVDSEMKEEQMEGIRETGEMDRSTAYNSTPQREVDRITDSY